VTTFSIIPDTTQNSNLKIISNTTNVKVTSPNTESKVTVVDGLQVSNLKIFSSNTSANVSIVGFGGPSGILFATSPVLYDSVTKTISLGPIDAGTI
jgi:hypothetical protein